MTASIAASGRGGAWRWLIPVLLAVGVTVWLMPSSTEETAYDLDAPQPDGYRGLRLLLEGEGATVDRIDADELTPELAASHDVVFVPLGDAVDEAGARRLRSLAASGTRVVLGSPSIWLGAPATDDVDPFASTVDLGRRGVCQLDELTDGPTLQVPLLFGLVRVRSDDRSCYGDVSAAFVVRSGSDAGDVVTLASPNLFVNDAMGLPEPDETVGSVAGNAFVAQRLLGQVDGRPARLAVVTSGFEDTAFGSSSLLDLMSPGVKLGLLELAIAVLFYAVARGRRHGRLVTEPAPVAIAGSAFVDAVGSLLQRQGAATRAAEVVREGHCRELGRRLGQAPGTPRSTLAAVVADRTGRDQQAVYDLLTRPVESESDLLAVTRELDVLRQEALHV